MDLKKFKLEKMDINDLEEIVSIATSNISNPWSKNMFLEELKNPFSYCFSFKNYLILNPHVVAFVCFRIIEDESELLNICVHPEYRNLGIGKRLMEFYINYCKSNQIRRLHLEVEISNQPAIHLYNSLSFKPIRIIDKFYQGKFDAIHMIKEI